MSNVSGQHDLGRQAVEQIEAQLSVQDQLDIAELNLRGELARRIIGRFIAVNFVVLGMVLAIFAIESYFIFLGKLDANTRIVTANVIMSIIGATTVQFGAISFAVSRWLFPNKEKSSPTTN